VSYKKYRHVKAPVRGIAQKRQFIVEHADRSKFMQVDDDMTLAHVYEDGEKVRIENSPTPPLVRIAVKLASDLLDQYAHGGFHTRHFVNYAPRPYVLNRGYYRQIMCFNPKMFKDPAPQYTGNTAEDVRFMLELLKRGKDYFLITDYCMLEHVPRGERKTWSHWSQEEKIKDMKALAKEHEQFSFTTADGRPALRYAAILKHYKKGKK